jgi:hypothetical protein
MVAVTVHSGGDVVSPSSRARWWKVQQEATATCPANTDLMRPKQALDLRQRPASTSLPLVHTEEVIQSTGSASQVVLAVRLDTTPLLLFRPCSVRRRSAPPNNAN